MDNWVVAVPRRSPRRRRPSPLALAAPHAGAPATAPVTAPVSLPSPTPAPSLWHLLTAHAFLAPASPSLYPGTRAPQPQTRTPAPPKPKRKGKREAAVHLLSGGVSAGLVRAALQPLDTCKTRLQHSATTVSLATLRTTLLRGTGVAGLYRGVVPGVVGIVPSAAVYMLVYQSLKRKFAASRVGRRFRGASIAAAAAAGDVVASLVRVPCEMTKQRLQVGAYRSAVHAVGELRSEIATGGSLVKLYSGLGAQLARDIPFVVVEFLAFESLKALVQGEKNSEPLGKRESLVIGGACGALAAVASNPFDVVKTRIMTQMKQGGAAAGRKTYAGVADCLVRIAREEGVATFARGLAPRMAAKTLQSALFFATYEVLRKQFGKMILGDAPTQTLLTAH